MAISGKTRPSTRQFLSREQFDLSALFEFSTIVNSSLDLKFILGHFLLTLMGKLLSSRAMVLLLRGDETYVVESVRGISSEMLGQSVSIKKVPQRVIDASVGNREEKYLWMKFFRDNGIHVIIPMTVRGRTLGIAGFGASARHRALSRAEVSYAKALANIAGTAIDKGLYIDELSAVNRQLDRKVQELNTLFELGKEFNAVLDVDRLVKLLMFSVMGQIGASKYFICLEQGGRMREVGGRMEGKLDGALLDSFFPTIASPVVVTGLTKARELEFQKKLQSLGIQALIPLQIHKNVKGVLGLGPKMRGDEYIQADLEYLSSLGNLATIAIENARLFHEALEKQRLEDELLLAKEIQRGLLPDKLPAIPKFDLAAINLSSKQVGGDYYDVIELSPTRFVLAIGDVSGKGTPASLLMANLQATIRALVPLGLSLSELTKRVNDLICENTGQDRFITFFWGILDAEVKKLRYVSAGHNPPIVFRTDGTIEKLDKGGIILGVMKTLIPYQEGEVTFEVGDVLVMFTDGVSEAMDVDSEEWGEDRLEEIGRNMREESSAVILNRIVKEVQEHSKNTIQSDDITLVIAKALS